MADRDHGVFMELIIGGSFQGKLQYAKQKLKNQRKLQGTEGFCIWQGEDMRLLSDREMPDGAMPGSTIPGNEQLPRLRCACDGCGEGRVPQIVNALHLFIQRCVEEGREEQITAVLDELLMKSPDCIIICDETGYGVVPIDRTERRYREAVGRTLCYLAGRAEHMERIVGGLPMKIK